VSLPALGKQFGEIALGVAARREKKRHHLKVLKALAYQVIHYDWQPGLHELKEGKGKVLVGSANPALLKKAIKRRAPGGCPSAMAKKDRGGFHAAIVAQADRPGAIRQVGHGFCLE
jgi:hypothetical protein